RASQPSPVPARASASSVPSPIVSGSATPSSRTCSPVCARSSRSPTREASENRTSARGNSARSLISLLLGVTPSTASGPWVSSSPTMTKAIGAVMSNLFQPRRQRAPAEYQRCHDGQVGGGHARLSAGRRSLDHGLPPDLLRVLAAELDGLVNPDDRRR